MQQNTHTSPGRPLASLLKRAHLLLLIVIGAVAVAVPMSAQSFDSGRHDNRNHPWYGRRYQLTTRFLAPT